MFDTGGFDLSKLLSGNRVRNKFDVRYLRDMDHPDSSGWLNIEDRNCSCRLDLFWLTSTKVVLCYRITYAYGFYKTNTLYNRITEIDIGTEYENIALIKAYDGCIELRFISEYFYDSGTVFKFIINFKRNSIIRTKKKYSRLELTKFCVLNNVLNNGTDDFYIEVMLKTKF